MPTTQLNLIECINPATEEKIFEISPSSESEIKDKVNKAKNTVSFWSNLSIEKRISYLSTLYKIIVSDRENIAKEISTNTGKPLAEVYITEIASALQVIDYYIKNTSRLLKEKNIFLGALYPTKKSHLSYSPHGVIAIIKPWNYPFYLPLSAMTKALATGNTCVIKPAPQTAYIGKLIEDLCLKADLPDGVVNFIYGDSNEGNILLDSEIDKVVFTGSTEIGKLILEKCTKRFIPVTLELGGKDPAIVLKDSNLDYVTNGILWGALSNCGQACASIERVYVHSDIYDAFIEEITLLTKKLKVGNPKDDEIDIGPLANKNQLEKVESHIEDATSKGANIHCGGKRIDSKGFFFEPTIISNVNHSMKIMTEETFGPVIPIMKFDTEEEALQLANDTKYGLAASIWTGDSASAKSLANKLNCGTVWVNDSLFLQAHPQCPWQGYKESGYGSSTIYDFVRTKHISIDKGYISSIRPKSFWWYPYKGKARSFLDLINVVFKPQMKEKAKAAFDTFIDFLK